MTARRDDKESQTRSKGAVYQGGSEAVFAILIAAGIGYWIDSHFDTAPIGLLIGVAIGFASFTLRMIQLGRQVQRQYSNEVKEIDKSKSENE